MSYSFEGRNVLTFLPSRKVAYSVSCAWFHLRPIFTHVLLWCQPKRSEFYSKLTVWQQLTAEYVAENGKYPVLLETLRKPYFSDGEFPEKIRVHFTCCPLLCYR
jgi:hypothetical protein